MTIQQLPPGLTTSMQQPMAFASQPSACKTQISSAPSCSTTSTAFMTQSSPSTSPPVTPFICPTDMPSNDHHYENESDLHRALRENYELKLQIKNITKESSCIKKENKVINVQIAQSQRRIKHLKNTLKKYSEGIMPTKLKEKIGRYNYKGSQ